MNPLLCISHLRWDFVWQRPQHLLKRLSQQRRVLFVEEPVTSTEADVPRLDIWVAAGAPNVTVIRLIQPARDHFWIGHGDPFTQSTYAHLLRNYLAAQHIDSPLLWLYTPMALDFADSIAHSLLIVDVMDQLSAFKGAPPELIAKEERALRRADVVFAGGASLYRAKKPFNANTYLFPSGVEIDHFAAAANRSAFARPSDLRGVDAPILGYFGVIDERMDLDLLGRLAINNPSWQIVMIGPVVKINPAWLPHAANLHYLGGRSYAELPAYLAYFDVALLPFALNESTQFISPTKTLEYMAAHKPIVSTPINDVIELYGSVVRVGNSAEQFAGQVRAALLDSPETQRMRENELLQRNTWDSIATRMGNLINEKIAEKLLPRTLGEATFDQDAAVAARR